ncbi:MAG: hypothetical protein NWQ19_01050 [Nonlabens sp.]|nr:hypothetical protein [Nonlabens sp.]
MNISNAFIALLLSYFTCSAQNNLKSYEPVAVFTPDLSEQKDTAIKRQYQLLEKENLSASEEKELNELLDAYGETVESIWDIIDGGCSWYCGGGNYKVMATSSLASSNGNNYEAKMANNLSYKTAWVEGKPDAGIGESISYTFKNDSPRITSIIISNGYQKSFAAWKNNNRVKALKLYVNNKPYAILNLQNSKTDQEFKVGILGQNKDKTDLVLKFEILEIYAGDKFNDTAITEIYFNGIDVH